MLLQCVTPAQMKPCRSPSGLPSSAQPFSDESLVGLRHVIGPDLWSHVAELTEVPAYPANCQELLTRSLSVQTAHSAPENNPTNFPNSVVESEDL